MTCWKSIIKKNKTYLVILNCDMKSENFLVNSKSKKEAIKKVKSVVNNCSIYEGKNIKYKGRRYM